MEETTTNNNNNAGFQPETTPLLERADITAKRIEEANKRAEELLKKNEEIYAKILLSGRATAGTTQPIVDPNKEQKDRLNKMFAGTGLVLK